MQQVQLHAGCERGYEFNDFCFGHLARAQQGAAVFGQVKVQADVISTTQFMRDKLVGFSIGQ